MNQATDYELASWFDREERNIVSRRSGADTEEYMNLILYHRQRIEEGK